MDHGQDANRGHLARLRVAHFVHELYNLVPTLKHSRAHGDHVAREQFVLVGDVLLHGRHRARIVAKEGSSDSELREQVPGRLVEFSDVPHYVHVPHVVAVPGVDRAAVGLNHGVHARGSSRVQPRSRSKPSSKP